MVTCPHCGKLVKIEKRWGEFSVCRECCEVVRLTDGGDCRQATLDEARSELDPQEFVWLCLGRDFFRALRAARAD